MTTADRDLTLFRCATKPGRESLKLWLEFTDQTTYESLTYRQHRLLPAVWKNLTRDVQDFPWKAQLTNLYRYTWGRNFQLQRAAESVIEILRLANVPTLVLKGLSLNLTSFPDMGMRPAHDFDLLVPFHLADKAIETLIREGWAWKQDAPSALRLEHGTQLIKGGLKFDLHWFALWEARDRKWDVELWENAVSFPLGNIQALRLSPTHQLFHLLLNGSREPENRVRYLLDLHFFLQRFGDEIDVEHLQKMLIERHLFHRLSYIDLEELGWERLKHGASPTWFDRCWSWCSRGGGDGVSELSFGVFPFFDYWLHFYGHSERGLSFGGYLQYRLRVESLRDLFSRSWAKLLRTLGVHRKPLSQ